MLHYEPAEILELGLADTLVLGDKTEFQSDGAGSDWREPATTVDIDE
jgi:hypothetical protein